MSIGEPVARLDGPAKVTGAARYAADQYADGQLYRPRAQALLHIMLIFRLQPRGFTTPTCAPCWPTTSAARPRFGVYKGAGAQEL